jgi:hypothetical protein
MIIREPVNRRPVIRGCWIMDDNPNPATPIIRPIIAPAIGNRYMFFATVSRSLFFDGIMVKKETTDFIPLNK